ncbi:Predicted N-acetyltransferase YhbS [Bradyrhizobium sp. Rc3b]|nr:Predicted N-acetyltransferase YhbS [Bradyrhizobium sp. Rc3b]
MQAEGFGTPPLDLEKELSAAAARWTALRSGAIPRIDMTDLSLTILPEAAGDAQSIERLHERTFGPGRFVLSAYRIREHVDHLLELSFTARIGTLLVGSVRQLPVLVGETPALLLGPLTVEPPFRGRGVGRLLMERALKDAKAKGHRLVLLVGDEPYYSRVGFKPVPKGRVTMPGPVDAARILVFELVDGAFEGVSGPVGPDWSKARAG